MSNLIFDHTDRWSDRIILTSEGKTPGGRIVNAEFRPADGRVTDTVWWPSDVKALHGAITTHLASPAKPERRVLWSRYATVNSELAAMVGTSDLMLRIGDVDSVRLSGAALRDLVWALGGWLVSSDLSTPATAPAGACVTTGEVPVSLPVPAPGLEERVAALEEVVQRLTHGITDLLQILQGGRDER